MRDYYPPLLPGVCYHIYNRGNNKENIFYQPKNYGYFLRKYKEYLLPWLDTFAYCLLPNHFHLMARVKDLEHFLVSPKFMAFSELADDPDFPSFQNLESLVPGQRVYLSATVEMKCHEKVSEFISEQFRRFFMGYSKAINKQQQRTGSLFQKNFKRLVVTDEAHFGHLLYYIHANAQLHGICPDFREYPYSSFPAYLSGAVSNLKREEVIAWFGAPDAMIKAHHPQLDFKNIEALIIEDD
jgi:hypothetical protein